MYIQDFSKFSYKNQPLTFVLYVVMLVLSLVSVVYVLGNTPNQPGTRLYFSLPLTFFLCLIFFRRNIPYHEGGYALKVFYFFCALRYVFLPFLTCQVGQFASSWTREAYIYAIIVQDIELITCFTAINYYYKKQYNKIAYKLSNSQSYFYEDLTFGGLIVIGVAGLLIAIRGVGSLLSTMRFLIVTDHLEEDLGGYDKWMAHTMLAFFAVVVTSHFQKRNERSNSIWNIMIPAIVCFLSVAIILGNNRMMTFYYAFSALSILSVSFPKYKKGISVTLLAVVALVIFSFTMVKQYNTNVSEGETADVSNEGMAASMAVYVSSTEAIAKTWDMYALTGDRMQFATIFADVIEKTPIFHLPGMPMTKWVEGIRPSWRLAMTGSEVVPVAGQMLYYGGYTFGWILDIIAFWFVMLLLVKFEIHSKLEVNLGNRYLYTWMSVICAMVMCYHLGIMWNAFAYVPFFLWMALTVNRKIVLYKRTKIATSDTAY